MDTINKGVDAMSDFIQGNAFGSAVGSRIEKATDTSLASENWALNMEICDMINDSEDGPRDAMRAIRKRLQQNMGKNHTVVMYTLTVLETCVKNCGKRFHVLVCQKEFVQELVKMIGTKFDPPQIIQEKVLGLIQSWADAFRNVPELQGAVEIYNELKAKGVDFPMTDLDSMAPVLTPARSIQAQGVPPSGYSVVASRRGADSDPAGSPAMRPTPPVAAQPFAPEPPIGPITMTPEQLSKMRGELDIVQTNLRILREMLTEMAPGQETPEDLQLLQDLYNTCRAMQQRIVDLLSIVANEEVTSELLLLNDELNNVFSKYERYMKSSEKDTAAVPNPSSAAVPPNNLSSALIDFDTSTGTTTPSAANVGGVTSAVGAMSVQSKHNPSDDNFDMFAQSRNTTYEKNKQTGSTYADNTEAQFAGLNSAAKQRDENVAGQGANAVDSESDIQEMEEWLKNQAPPVRTDGTMTPEFKQFLARRSTAGAQLPFSTSSSNNENNINNPFVNNSSSSAGSTRRNQQANISLEDSLFEL